MPRSPVPRAHGASVVVLVACALTVGAWLATGAARADEPVATFSIVGFDPETGDLGVAVQSRFFAVGAVVPWAKAGVGAIATQAFANTTFGPRGLARLADGASPDEVIAELTASDDRRESRQIGIVDARGRAASYTGAQCQDWAGHVVGEHFAAQGNILAGEAVVRAMARAYEATDDELGERLMRAIEAGQAAGGDSRGQQSMALLIVRAGGGYGGYDDRWCDLRVDDHPTPIAEMRRLFDLWRWNASIQAGYTELAAGDVPAALERVAGLVALRPDDGESWYHPACWLARAGRSAEALRHLREAVAREPSLGPRAAGDPDFASLAEDPGFVALTAPSSP